MFLKKCYTFACLFAYKQFYILILRVLDKLKIIQYRF